jgi:hypothetical protein
VERNKAIIVFPSSARFLWWLHRLNPNALDRPNVESLKGFRKIRRE